MVPGESKVPGCRAPSPTHDLLLPGNTAPIQLYSSSPRALLADSLRVPVALSPVTNLCLFYEPVYQTFWTLCLRLYVCVHISQLSWLVQSRSSLPYASGTTLGKPLNFSELPDSPL